MTETLTREFTDSNWEAEVLKSDKPGKSFVGVTMGDALKRALVG